MYGRTSNERLPRLAEAIADLRDKPSRSRTEEVRYVAILQLFMAELRLAGRRAEAIRVGEEAVEAARTLDARFSGRYHGFLAQCLVSQADTLVPDIPESIGEIRLLTDEAIALSRPWLKDTPATRAQLLATAYGARGHAELEAGDVDAAEPMLWQAFDSARRMRRRDRLAPQQLAWLAGVVGALARCSQARGDMAEADRLAAKSHELAEAGKAVRLAGKEMWAAVSEVGDVFRGRTVRASDADGSPPGTG
jgi:tetratricopeptide (TPR) repeat protein